MTRVNFTGLYVNKELADTLNKYEQEFNVKDETSFFQNFVNTSISKYRPYYGWIRYREGYSGDLVKELVKRSGVDPTCEFVADPMSGSGSTLIACKQIGVDSLGLDVNPFVVETSNSKLHNYSKSELEQLTQFIENTSLQADFSVEDEQFNPVKTYFTPKNFQDLMSLRSKIDTFNGDKLHLLFQSNTPPACCGDE